jgi:hypothetical protein
MLSGCATDSQTNTNAGGATLAFESIDGPPRPVFDRLVSSLAAQAQAHQITVVSREGPARYRVRAYLAARLERGRGAIGWVWDVYDAQQQRVMRIQGDELVGSRKPEVWTAADDQVLDRIADAGMRQFAAFAAQPPDAPAAPADAPDLPAYVAASAPAEEPAAAAPKQAAAASRKQAAVPAEIQVAAASPASPADGRSHR